MLILLLSLHKHSIKVHIQIKACLSSDIWNTRSRLCATEESRPRPFQLSVMRVSSSAVSDSLPPHGLYQAPLPMEFSRQEYWSGLQFHSPGESYWPRDQAQASCIAGRFLIVWATREALIGVWPNLEWWSGWEFYIYYCKEKSIGRSMIYTTGFLKWRSGHSLKDMSAQLT